MDVGRIWGLTEGKLVLNVTDSEESKKYLVINVMGEAISIRGKINEFKYTI